MPVLRQMQMAALPCFETQVSRLNAVALAFNISVNIMTLLTKHNIQE